MVIGDAANHGCSRTLPATLDRLYVVYRLGSRTPFAGGCPSAPGSVVANRRSCRRSPPHSAQRHQLPVSCRFTPVLLGALLAEVRYLAQAALVEYRARPWREAIFPPRRIPLHVAYR